MSFMNGFRALAILGGLACCAAAPAYAAISFERVADINLIMITGTIEEGDDKKFNQLAIQHEDAIVTLQSDGGHLVTALEIGKALHLKGYSTYVPSNMVCASSCALIWAAGTKRFLEKTSRIGFHASYRKVGGRAEETGVGNAIIGRYLTLLNLPERAIVFATTAAPSDALWLDPLNPGQSGIAFELLQTGQDEQPAGSDSAQLNKFEWDGANGWSVWNTADRCTAMVTFSIEGSVGNNSSMAVSHELEDGPSIVFFQNQKFKSVIKDKKYSIDVRFVNPKGIVEPWGLIQANSFKDEDGDGFTFQVDRERFIQAVSRNISVNFYFQGEIIDNYPLKGSTEAIRQLRSCAELYGKNLRDPFRSGLTDPFGN